MWGRLLVIHPRLHLNCLAVTSSPPVHHLCTSPFKMHGVALVPPSRVAVDFDVLKDSHVQALAMPLPTWTPHFDNNWHLQLDCILLIPPLSATTPDKESLVTSLVLGDYTWHARCGWPTSCIAELAHRKIEPHGCLPSGVSARAQHPSSQYLVPPRARN